MSQSRNLDNNQFGPRDPAAALRLEHVMNLDAEVQSALDSINVARLHINQGSSLNSIQPHIKAAQHNLVAVHSRLRNEAASVDWLRKEAA